MENICFMLLVPIERLVFRTTGYEKKKLSLLLLNFNLSVGSTNTLSETKILRVSFLGMIFFSNVSFVFRNGEYLSFTIRDGLVW